MAANTKAELQARLAKLERALAREKKRKGDPDALARSRDAQAATARILRVIRRSPSDVQPVFEAIAEAAMRLLKAFSVIVVRYDGSQVQFAAARGARPGSVARVRALYPRAPGNATIVGRCILARKVVYHADAWRDRNAEVRKIARTRGYRSALAVPLLDGREPIGAIAVSRAEAGAFARADVELLRTFADQAVIAVENARQLRETKEALERQTATADILKVISGSPDNVQPVLDAVAHSSMRLLGALSASVSIRVGDTLQLGAFTSTSKTGDQAVKDFFPLSLTDSRETILAQSVLKAAPAQVGDAQGPRRRPQLRQIARRRGFQSIIAVPMLSKGLAIGTVSVTRREAGGFSEHEVELLTTFADQAVIAIENVRLFNRTKEALERQTATAEILKVISRSPTDVQPVLDAIAANSMRLLGALSAGVELRVGNALHLAAFTSTSPSGDEALKRMFPMSLDDRRKGLLARVVLTATPLRIGDMEAAEVSPEFRKMARRRGYRSLLVVPMLSKGGAIGSVSVTRREAGDFSDHDVELLTAFADQAVIAIENVRLFNETKEALEHQTATSDVLRVISTSPTDVQPVLDAIAESAARLCESSDAQVLLCTDSALRIAAQYGSEIRDTVGTSLPLDRDSATARAVIDSAMVHVADVSALPAGELERTKTNAAASGWQSILSVPLLRDGAAVGAIAARRSKASAFTPRQIALLKTFADQAVIAIENVRLFNETKEALERQTATAEILKVISGSPTDVQPVLEAVAERAAHLCAATDAHVWRREGDALQVVADYGDRPVRRPRLTISRQSVMGRAVANGAPIHVLDLPAVFESEFPDSRAMMEGGYRTILGVPLLREGNAIGGILIRRTAVSPFSEKQIALLQTFADQAVIAIENVRLFNQTREALERQTATAEILKVISGSPTDVQPVFDAVASHSMRLLGARSGTVTLRAGDALHLAAFTSTTTLGDDALKKFFPVSLVDQRDTILAQAALSGAPVHVPDTEDPHPSPTLREIARRRGYRSILAVPMLSKGTAIGTVSVSRGEAGRFSDHDIELLTTFANQAAIAIENARLFNETKDALERQTATAEILKVISDSPTDIQPVLDAVAENSARLCEASDAIIQLREGDRLRWAAHYGTMPNLALDETRTISRELVTGRAVLEGRQIHVDDLPAQADEYPQGSQISAQFGYHTILATPLMREGTAIGVIMIRHKEVRPFSDKHRSLVSTFADQAVIAIENVRLFKETQEALERQTATAEILKVIASSPSNVQPVFDAIVTSAKRLFAAKSAVLLQRGESHFSVGAYAGPEIADLPEEVREAPLDPDKNFPSRAILRAEIVHIPDWAGDDIPEHEKIVGQAFGIRSGLIVPLLRNDVGIGAIAVTRETAGPYDEKEIALLRSFADQAVIAIENVRLFNETQEALERQTATAEVLRAISASPTDTQPVFDIIAERAVALCGGRDGIVLRYDGSLVSLAAHYNLVPDAGEVMRRAFPTTLERNSAGVQSIRTRSVVQIHDVNEIPDYHLSGAAQAGGVRRMLAVPLMRGAEAIGAVAVSHVEPGTFSDHQVGLVRTFADQAVIAIENVRLFNETKEALERQTATAEILRVISTSPTDVQPVFEAIVASAARLCDAAMSAVARYDGGLLHLKAVNNMSAEEAAAYHSLFPREPGRHFLMGRAFVDARPVHIEDIEADPDYERRTLEVLKRVAPYRTYLGIPIVREGVPIGAIGCGRREIKPFTPEQIELVKTFADQAAIAIENVRLFNETKEALERQTATSEILKVMSGSPTDVQPVFNTIVKNAVELSDALFSAVYRYDGEQLHLVAHHNYTPEVLELESRVYPMRPDRGQAVGRAILDRALIHIQDALQDADYQHDIATTGGWRSMVAVPMFRDESPVGVIWVARAQAGSFSSHQIELLETFADQAVIAIENVRLFNETKEALERQTATAEILEVISRSQSDLQPVFDTIASNAVQLCNGDQGLVFSYDGAQIHIESLKALSPEGEAVTRRIYPQPAGRGFVTGRAVLTCSTVQVADVMADPEYQHGHAAKVAEWRSVLSVPMLRAGAPIGAITVVRHQPMAFSEHQVALLKTFADQAVIAIENVRLFNETKEALERQTATAEILKVIAASPSDVQPVFDAIAQSARQLIGGRSAVVVRRVGDELHLESVTATTAAADEALKKSFPTPLTGQAALGKAILSGQPAYSADVDVDPAFSDAYRETMRARGTRSFLAVPMTREGSAIGGIAVTRGIAGPFSDHQISLLQTFADQAVIAIENVRLFNETKEALERQTATAEILKVISSSPTDVQPVFDAIVRSAVRLCDAVYGVALKVEGSVVHLATQHKWPEKSWARAQQMFPMSLDSDHLSAVAIRENRVIRVDRLQDDPDLPVTSRELAKLGGYHALLIVPMSRGAEAIGAIDVASKSAFSDDQIALLKTFADQAVIAVENVRLFNETKEALEQQRASGEVLSVISNSVEDAQPVFEKIVESCERLFAGSKVGLNLIGPDGLVHAGAYGKFPGVDKLRTEGFPHPATAESATGAAILARDVIHYPDALGGAEVPFYARRGAQTVGFRSFIMAPLLSEGRGLGAIFVGRETVGSFSEKEIALLKTFADQAVIAIQNARLFNETKEALERQTATAEILGVISGSPTDVQPVFDAIVHSALRIFAGTNVGIGLAEGERMRFVASGGNLGELPDDLQVPLSPESVTGLAVLERRTVDIPDTEAPDAPLFARENGRRLGFRAMASTPLLREGEPIGAITVLLPEPGGLNDKQLALLKTFADQAVIAIENVRLFNETREALERQTATAEILQVIGRSPTDTQPVFDAIVNSGVRLFPGAMISVARPVGESVRAAAIAHEDAAMVAGWRERFTTPLSRDRLHAAAILDAKLIDIPDAEAETDGPLGPGVRNFLLSGNRAVTIMPMLRGEGAIGAISVTRTVPGPLSDKQIAILRTFADQAVIAIENVRLFKELQERTEALTKSVGQLTALGEVSQALSSTLDLDKVLQTIVSRAVQLTGLDGGAIYEFEEASQTFHLRGAESLPEPVVALFRSSPMRLGEGAIGRAGMSREAVQVPDILAESYQSRVRDFLIRSGSRAVLAVPLLREGNLLGALAVIGNRAGEFPPEVVELMQTFATQSAIAIQNARLFREIEEKGRELQLASQHKSQFLASMSHELRTPLNAILGFNEMILGEVYGEVPTDMKEPLEDIQTSGKHLLRLINNVLDLAKIEAGRMELALADYSVQDMVESVRSTLRPLAEAKGLELLTSVPNDVPLAHGDSGRLTQCLMNLAGNSLKFTKEGNVSISVVPNGQTLAFRVSDTGIGIPAEKIDSLFTEFKQTDATIASEYGGTGLGLAITKQFIEMHGGRIWVESELGKGSTFAFEIPLRAEAGATA